MGTTQQAEPVLVRAVPPSSFAGDELAGDSPAVACCSRSVPLDSCLFFFAVKG